MLWFDAKARKYKGAAFRVLWQLARRANKQGVCWPTVFTLSKDAECSKRWVRAILSQLETDGTIYIHGRGGGRGHQSVYKLIGLDAMWRQAEFQLDEQPTTEIPAQEQLEQPEERGNYSSSRTLPSSSNPTIRINKEGDAIDSCLYFIEEENRNDSSPPPPSPRFNPDFPPDTWNPNYCYTMLTYYRRGSVCF